MFTLLWLINSVKYIIFYKTRTTKCRYVREEGWNICNDKLMYYFNIFFFIKFSSKNSILFSSTVFFWNIKAVNYIFSFIQSMIWQRLIFGVYHTFQEAFTRDDFPCENQSELACLFLQIRRFNLFNIPKQILERTVRVCISSGMTKVIFFFWKLLKSEFLIIFHESLSI